MAKYERFPYFGPTVRLARELMRFTQGQLGYLIDLGGRQIGKYEKRLDEKDVSRPSLEQLGDLLEKLGMTLEGFGALMRVLEEVATGRWPRGIQYELFGEVREPGDREFVTRILCLTDRGKLLAVDDIRLNQWLNSSLETLNPKREVVLTLKVPPG